MNTNAEAVRDNWIAQTERIRTCTLRAGRPEGSVKLVAVSKTHPGSAIEALLPGGQRDFGESYVQELRAKMDALPSDVRWHFIGHLQSNKARQIAGQVHLIHSVDRSSLLAALAGTRQDILLQVNVSGETTKSGCRPDEVRALLAQARSMADIRVRGLMTMAPQSDDPEHARPHFRALASLAADIRHELSQLDSDESALFTELSMGMSHDIEPAIEEGATLVRIGTAIFGERA
jgi:hypothetical protein